MMLLNSRMQEVLTWLHRTRKSTPVVHSLSHTWLLSLCFSLTFHSNSSVYRCSILDIGVGSQHPCLLPSIIPRGRFMGIPPMHRAVFRRATHFVLCPAVTVIKFLIILSLNLCLLCKWSLMGQRSTHISRGWMGNMHICCSSLPHGTAPTVFAILHEQRILVDQWCLGD